MQQRAGLAADEWWPAEVAQRLDLARSTVHSWIRRGQVRARREEQPPFRWIIWADATELDRLRQYRQRSLSAEAHGRWTATQQEVCDATE